MALDARTNFASVVVSGISGAADTAITLSPGEVSKLPPSPTIAAENTEYNLVWYNSTDFLDPKDDPNVEIVRVTQSIGDILTVTRGAETTTPTTKNVAGKVYLMHLSVTRQTLDQAERTIQDSDTVTAVDTSILPNIHEIAPIPDVPAYKVGQVFRFEAANTNTAPAVTLNVSALGAIQIVKRGALTLSPGDIQAGDVIEVVYDSGNCFQMISNLANSQPGIQILQTATAAADATIEFIFTSSLSEFDNFILMLSDVTPSSNDVELQIQVSDDGGATFENGATDYRIGLLVARDNSTAHLGRAASRSSMLASDTAGGNSGASNVAGRSLSSTIRMSIPGSATQQKLFHIDSVYSDASGNRRAVFGLGAYIATLSAIDGLQFRFSAGNIATGYFALYGVKKS